MNVNRWTLPMVALLVAALAAGCGSGDDDGGAGGSLTVGLPGVPPIYPVLHTYVAQEKGYYRDLGAGVTFRPFQTGTDAARSVESGDIDASWSPTSLALAMRSKGVPIVAIEGIGVPTNILATIDEDLDTCPEMKGTTVGVDTVGGADYLMLQAYLRTCGLSIRDDVNTVNLQGLAPLQALASGRIKVAVQELEELPTIEKEAGRPIKIVAYESDFQPDNHHLVLITRKETLEKKRDAFVAMLGGDLRAVRTIYDEPQTDEVVRIGTFGGFDEEGSAKALAALREVRKWSRDDAGLARRSIESTIDREVEAGNIEADRKPTYAEFVDTRPYTDALARVGG